MIPLLNQGQREETWEGAHDDGSGLGCESAMGPSQYQHEKNTESLTEVTMRVLSWKTMAARQRMDPIARRHRKHLTVNNLVQVQNMAFLGMRFQMIK